MLECTSKKIFYDIHITQQFANYFQRKLGSSTQKLEKRVNANVPIILKSTVYVHVSVYTHTYVLTYHYNNP